MIVKNNIFTLCRSRAHAINIERDVSFFSGFDTDFYSDCRYLIGQNIDYELRYILQSAIMDFEFCLSGIDLTISTRAKRINRYRY